MTLPVTECLIKLHEERHDIEDYQGGVPRWCSGCGDNAILAAVQRLCRDEGLAPERTVFVSGIGCSSRFPHYMDDVQYPDAYAADYGYPARRARRAEAVLDRPRPEPRITQPGPAVDFSAVPDLPLPARR